MKTCIIALTLNLALVGAANAQYGSSDQALVESWYNRYLRRNADPIGIRSHVTELRRGTPVDFVEASILGSDEYWLGAGGTPEAFIASLHRDVIGVNPSPRDLRYWVERYLRSGSRHLLALRFLQEQRTSSLVRPPSYTDPEPGYGPPPVYVPGTVRRPGLLLPRDVAPGRSDLRSGTYRNLPFDK